MYQMPGEGIKTNNFLKDWMIDRVNDSAKLNDRGEYESGGLTGLIGGALGLDVGLIEDRKGKRIEHKAAQDLMRQAGLTNEDLGIGKNEWITTGEVVSKKRANDKAELKAEKKEIRDNQVADRNAAFGQEMSMQSAQLASQAANNKAGLDAAREQYLHSTQMQENRYAHEKAEGRLDRRHQQELAMLSGDREMAIAQMSAELQDKRMDYDRETRSMDKRDRMIAQLLSGLGSLGSAFG